jgi:hypothetical protein
VGELVGVGVGEFGGGEGGAVDAVAAGAAAEGDDAVAGRAAPWTRNAGHEADAAAEDEGIADVAVVEATAPLRVGMPMRLP